MSEQATVQDGPVASGPEVTSAAPEGMSDAELNASILSSLPAPEPKATTPVAAPAAAVPAATPAAASAADADIEARIAKAAEKAIADAHAHSELKAGRAAEAARAEKAEKELQALKARLAEDPLGAVAENGHDFESLTALAVGGKAPAEVETRKLAARLKQLEAEKAADKAAREAAEQDKAVQASVAGYVAKNVTPVVEGGKDSTFKFLVAEHGSVEAATQEVYGILNRIYQERGQEVPAVDVAKALEEKYAAKAERYKAHLANPGAAAVQTPASKPKPKSLTNQLTQSVPAVTADDEDISDDALNKKALAFAASVTA